MTRKVCKTVYTGKPWSYVQHATKYMNKIFGGVKYFRGCGPGYVTFGVRKFFMDYTFDFKYGVSFGDDYTMVTFTSDKGTLVITFEDAGNGNVKVCASWSGMHEFWFKGALKDFLDQFSDALVELCKDPTFCRDPNDIKPMEYTTLVTMNSLAFMIRGVGWPDAKITAKEVDGEKSFTVIIRGGMMTSFKFCVNELNCSEITGNFPIETIDYTLFEDLGIDGTYNVRVEPIE